MTRNEAAHYIESKVDYKDTGRCPSCGWHGCRDYYHCIECGGTAARNSQCSVEHTPECTVTKLIQEFGEEILDEAF